MDVELDWLPPQLLIKPKNLIYSIKNIKKLPEATGIYIFARQHGDARSPLYIGKADNLQHRVSQQFNNLKLMMAVRKAEVGKRILMLAELKTHQGQDAKELVKRVESVLIKQALADGFELLNIQGTKVRTNTINNRGKRTAHTPFTRKMNYE